MGTEASLCPYGSTGVRLNLGTADVLVGFILIFVSCFFSYPSLPFVPEDAKPYRGQAPDREQRKKTI